MHNMSYIKFTYNKIGMIIYIYPWTSFEAVDINNISVIFHIRYDSFESTLLKLKDIEDFA